MFDLSDYKEPPFFILGVQRSGTTLLRLMLNSHSRIAIPEEATFLRPLLTKDNAKGVLNSQDISKICNYLNKSPHFSLWNYDKSELFEFLQKHEEISLNNLIEAIYVSYLRSERKGAWGDKTPSLFRNIDLLYKLFPNAKFIHIVRDARDIFLSWRKMDPTKGNPSVVAMEWEYKCHKIEKFLNRIPEANRLRLRYEDLLGEPENTLKHLCNFLAFEYEPQMLSFHKKSKFYIGNHHSDLIFRPIDKSNKQKWKKQLSVKETKIITILAQRYLKEYDYEMFSEKSNVQDYLSVCASLTGVPIRLAQVMKTNTLFKKALQGKEVSSEVGKKPEEKREESHSGL